MSLHIAQCAVPSFTPSARWSCLGRPAGGNLNASLVLMPCATMAPVQTIRQVGVGKHQHSRLIAQANVSSQVWACEDIKLTSVLVLSTENHIKSKQQ